MIKTINLLEDNISSSPLGSIEHQEEIECTDHTPNS